MMISLISFGVSWVVYALVFFFITALMPQNFHSTYHEVIFQVGFIIGFVDAALLRVIRVANFKIHWIGLILLISAIDWGLIVMTNNSVGDYTVTGTTAPIIAAVVLGAIVVGFDIVKNRVLADVRV